MDNKNNFDFDKTFNNLFSLAKREFKDVDEHFIKVAIYGYIYSDFLRARNAELYETDLW